MNRKIYLFILGILTVIMAAAFFVFDHSSETDAQLLKGKWTRVDGPYQIDIQEVFEAGDLKVSYSNPQPIHIGQSGWREKDGNLMVYIKLKDENYPGSIYRLNYIKEKDLLRGSYYQAVAKETYQVEFSR